MTQARPSLARKHTRSTESARNAALDSGIRVKIGDEVFEVRIGDITPQLAGELRRSTGMSFRLLMSLLDEDPDIDLLTAFEWLARRIRGEDVAMSDVEFTYEDMADDSFDMEELEGAAEEADPADPEA